MHRTQILLDDWQYSALKARAEREGRSISDMLREMISTELNGAQSGKPNLDAIRGVGEDRAAYGREHDQFLYGKQRKDR